MKITVTRTKKCGLEVFQVRVNGTLHNEYLSEQLAMTTYVLLRQRLVG